MILKDCWMLLEFVVRFIDHFVTLLVTAQADPYRHLKLIIRALSF